MKDETLDDKWTWDVLGVIKSSIFELRETSFQDTSYRDISLLTDNYFIGTISLVKSY